MVSSSCVPHYFTPKAVHKIIASLHKIKDSSLFEFTKSDEKYKHVQRL